MDFTTKQTIEACNGRITPFPNCWALTDRLTPYQKGRKVCNKRFSPEDNEKIFNSADADGKPVTLIGQKGVLCPSKEKCEGSFPYAKSGVSWWVPEAVCRKCEHRLKPRPSMNYPRCAIACKRRGGSEEADKYARKVKKIVDGWLGGGKQCTPR